jgi:hypothetical protein
MTTTLETPRPVSRLPTDELGAQARDMPRPGRVIATTVAGLFFAIGFVIGGLWRGIGFCAVSARYGYWKGLGWDDEQIAGVIARKRAAAQPPPAPA